MNLTAEIPDNPLEEVKLSEIFDKDPEDYSKEDIHKIAVELRRKRADFAKVENDKAARGTTKKVSLADSGVDLSKLELEI